MNNATQLSGALNDGPVLATDVVDTTVPNLARPSGKSILWCAWVVFGLSLALPAVRVTIVHSANVAGFVALCMAPMLIVQKPILLPIVFANLAALALPLWCRASQSLERRGVLAQVETAKGAAVLFGVAFAAALSLLASDFLADAQVGYFVWVTSLGAACLGLAIRAARWNSDATALARIIDGEPLRIDPPRA